MHETTPYRTVLVSLCKLNLAASIIANRDVKHDFRTENSVGSDEMARYITSRLIWI